MSQSDNIQIYLQLPDSELQTCQTVLSDLLPQFHIAACVLPEKMADTLWPVWFEETKNLRHLLQKHNCATLVMDAPDLDIGHFQKSGYDGIHVTQDLKRLTYWRTHIQEAYILGYGLCHTRHEAMLAGEQLADYVMLPSETSGTPIDRSLDLATSNNAASEANLLEWWSMMMETACVAVSPKTEKPDFLSDLLQIGQKGSDFVFLPATLWYSASTSVAETEQFFKKISHIIENI